jgi:hypothetical protein
MELGMTNNFNTPSIRGKNSVSAPPRKLVSGDGLRSALARTVKGETQTPGVYAAVEIWCLKRRINGKWVTEKTHVEESKAMAWVQMTNS